MLVLGPLSDRFGRRRTVLCGLALSAFASIICAISPTIEILIAARVLQGIGACAGLVVGRALTREIWGPAAAAQVIAGRAIAATLMQACAPVVGGYLQAWFGWRANFAAVAALACLAMVLMVCFVPARGPALHRSAGIRGIAASYRALIATRRFIAYAFAAAGAHAGFHIFAAGAPAVLIGQLRRSTPEHYGYYAALPPLGFLVGSFLSNRLTVRRGVNGHDPDRLGSADPGRSRHARARDVACPEPLYRDRADDLRLLRQRSDHPQRHRRQSRGQSADCRRRIRVSAALSR